MGNDMAFTLLLQNLLQKFNTFLRRLPYHFQNDDPYLVEMAR